MKYTIIAEPRTGGTALMNWIEKCLPEYDIAQEPYFIGNDRWVDGENTNDVDWIDDYDNIFIREIFHGTKKPLDKLIDKSDKVFCLYRENWYEQIKSILYQEVHTGDTYMTSYLKSEINKVITDDMILKKFGSFSETKLEFKKWIEDNNLISMSYEELYYADGIKNIKQHFNFNSDIDFPINKRHLKNDDGIETPRDNKTSTELTKIIYDILIKQNEFYKSENKDLKVENTLLRLKINKRSLI